LRPVPGMYKNCSTCVEVHLARIRTVAPVLRPIPGI